MNALKRFPRRAGKSVRLLHALALLLILVFALQLLDCPVAYADGGREITLLELSGSCSVERGGDALEATEGMTLLSGDTLVTDEGGSIRLRIDGDKFLYLGEDARVQITAEGTAESSRTVVFVEAGSVMTEVRQPLSEESSFEIVTPNSTMSIHGTKTLTEVIEDVVTGHVQTSNAVLEGQVKIKAVKVKADGTVVSVERDLGAGEGNAFRSTKEELVSLEEMQMIAGGGASVPGISVEIVSEEEADVVFDTATFDATFLESVRSILIADAEAAAGEEGLSPEEIDAINAQTDKVIMSLDLIREESQRAIDAAAEAGAVPQFVEPQPEVAPLPTVEPLPVVVPQEDDLPQAGDDDGDEGTTFVEGDTPLIDMDECNHDWSEWTLLVEPYADTDAAGLTVWHAGIYIRVCGICGESEHEAALVAPVLASELYADATQLPIDFFWIEGEQAPEDGMTLEEHPLPLWWVSSPMYDNDPATVIDLTGAEITWEDGGILLSSLSVDDTLVVRITVPEEFRDVFEDTDVTVTLIEPGVMYAIF